MLGAQNDFRCAAIACLATTESAGVWAWKKVPIWLAILTSCALGSCMLSLG